MSSEPIWSGEFLPIEKRKRKKKCAVPVAENDIIARCLLNNKFRSYVAEASTAQIEVTLQSVTAADGNVIPRERHRHRTQVIQCVSGMGKVMFDNCAPHVLEPGRLVTVPPKTWHEVVNTSPSNASALKFITFYVPPEHTDPREQQVERRHVDD